MNSVRPELVAAYRRTFGHVRHRGGGKERESAENAALASITHKPSQREVDRFKKHGLAHIPINIGFADAEFVVDLGGLKNVGAIRYAWFNQRPDRLRVTISNGKQTPRKNALIFELEKTVEGIRLTFTLRGRTKLLTPYETHPTVLYAAD